MVSPSKAPMIIIGGVEGSSLEEGLRGRNQSRIGDEMENMFSD